MIQGILDNKIMTRLILRNFVSRRDFRYGMTYLTIALIGHVIHCPCSTWKSASICPLKGSHKHSLIVSANRSPFSKNDLSPCCKPKVYINPEIFGTSRRRGGGQTTAFIIRGHP